ncbi:MAG: hypothetical protein ABIJ47_07940 [Candidatus Bathyarchaeota archaeon]
MKVFTEEERKLVDEGIKGTVFMFRAVWDEVDSQFSQLSKSEKFQIFEIIAPILSDMILTIPDLEEEEERLRQRKRGKNRK